MLDHTDPVASIIPAMSLDSPSDNAMTALSRLALGPVNTDYYLAVFERFDSTGRTTTTWNWAACLCTLNWMVFRQLWGAALVYVAAAEGLALIVFGVGRSFLQWPQGVELGVLGAFAVLAFAVPGLYGNALLHADVRKRIARALAASRTLPEASALLEKQASSRKRLQMLAGANVVLGIVAVLAYLALSPSDVKPLALEPAVTVAQATAAATAAKAASAARATQAAPKPASEPTPASAPQVAPVPPKAPAPPTTASAADASAASQAASVAPAVVLPPSALQAASAAKAPPSSSPTVAKKTPAEKTPSAQPALPSAKPTATDAEAPTPPTVPVASAPTPPRPSATTSAPAPRRDAASRATAASKPKATASAAAVVDASPPTVGTATGYYINVGLFAEEANARKTQARLLNEGLPAFRQALNSGTKGRRIRVRVGPYETRAQADVAAQAIRDMALEAVVFKQ